MDLVSLSCTCDIPMQECPIHKPEFYVIQNSWGFYLYALEVNTEGNKSHEGWTNNRAEALQMTDSEAAKTIDKLYELGHKLFSLKMRNYSV